MKILVISSEYPGPDLIYSDTFVQSRVREYQKHHQVMVMGHRPNVPDRNYESEGISVRISKSKEDFFKNVREFNSDVIAAHLATREIIPSLESLKKPLAVFLHGFETLSWKHRRMNYTSLGDLRYLIPYIVSNRSQLASMRDLVRRSNDNTGTHFVFVSSWLKQAAEIDLGVKFRNHSIIPNGIDLKTFSFSEKDESLRKKVLIIRSFRARNYANDLSIDAIVSLSRKEFFNELEFTIYGEGYLWGPLTKKIGSCKNISLHPFFIDNREIPGIHQNHGIFLCPSRLDTQGVSMCEAMACGLVPITSPTGGIPEFSNHGVDSFQVRTGEEIAGKIEFLFQNPDVFKTLSLNARQAMESKCDISQTAETELKLFASLVNQAADHR